MIGPLKKKKRVMKRGSALAWVSASLKEGNYQRIHEGWIRSKMGPLPKETGVKTLGWMLECRGQASLKEGHVKRTPEEWTKSKMGPLPDKGNRHKGPEVKVGTGEEEHSQVHSPHPSLRLLCCIHLCQTQFSQATSSARLRYSCFAVALKLRALAF